MASMTRREQLLVGLLEECIDASTQGFWDLHAYETDSEGEQHHTETRSQVARRLLDHAIETRERLEALTAETVA